MPNNNASNPDAYLSLMVIGDKASGKSALCLQYTHEKATPGYSPTQGIDFLYKRATPDKRSIGITLWDCQGRIDEYAFITSYFKASAAALLVFDVTNTTSFEYAKNRLASLKKNYPSLPCYLVGTKIDLGEKRAVTHNEALALANQQHATYIETSIKQPSQLTRAINSIVIEIADNTKRAEEIARFAQHKAALVDYLTTQLRRMRAGDKKIALETHLLQLNTIPAETSYEGQLAKFLEIKTSIKELVPRHQDQQIVGFFKATWARKTASEKAFIALEMTLQCIR